MSSEKLLRDAYAALVERDKRFDDLEIARQWVDLAHASPSIEMTTYKGVDLLVLRKPEMRRVFYEAYIKGKEQMIGRFPTMMPLNGRVQVTNAAVYDLDGVDYRQKGIGTAVYDLIETDLQAAGGEMVEPHWSSMSDEALEFWKKRRPDYADRIEELERNLGTMASGLFN